MYSFRLAHIIPTNPKASNFHVSFLVFQVSVSGRAKREIQDGFYMGCQSVWSIGTGSTSDAVENSAGAGWKSVICSRASFTDIRNRRWIGL
ncbi:hypothetical protein MPTK2_6g90450P [Marchantia polymorpha subsp. ruderalis]